MRTCALELFVDARLAESPRSQSRSRLIARALVCLSLFGFFGCTPGEDRDVAHTLPVARLHDSAGVRIMDYSLGQPSEHGAVVWALKTGPELQVGAKNGGAAGPFHIARAELLGGGRLVVGLRERNEVRLYDSSGAFVRSIGRRGRGLGEFRSFVGPWVLRGDRIAVYDPAARRVSVFDTSGEVQRTTSYSRRYSDSTAAYLQIMGFVQGGAALGIVGLPPPRTRLGVTRPNIGLVLLDITEQTSKNLGLYLGQEIHIGTASSDFQPLSRPPFAFATLAVACNGVIAIADNAAYEIRLMNSEGRLKAIIHAAVDPELVADADFHGIATEAARAAGRTAEVSDAEVRMVRARSSHAQMPILHALLLDHANRLWVEEFARPSERTRRVSVYSAEGLLLGAFELPTNLDLLSADRDRLVVREQLDSRSEVVRLYRLEALRPAPATGK